MVLVSMNREKPNEETATIKLTVRELTDLLEASTAGLRKNRPTLYAKLWTIRDIVARGEIDESTVGLCAECFGFDLAEE